ncbi:hypothetical protein C441_16424 [Haloferax sulfurifontis ATCC BAA-897]|uniref:Uncharacterized protein n=1 Tax=Haloferax sulfurifontis ATCC BAA-897 TaxID=662480 RepID=M0HZC8_9EURY|nr:hypothetical protein C441_16424 [Haloferax sulfurifontis ATCC BAA-897]
MIEDLCKPSIEWDFLDTVCNPLHELVERALRVGGDTGEHGLEIFIHHRWWVARFVQSGDCCLELTMAKGIRPMNRIEHRFENIANDVG